MLPIWRIVLTCVLTETILGFYTALSPTQWLGALSVKCRPYCDKVCKSAVMLQRRCKAYPRVTNPPTTPSGRALPASTSRPNPPRNILEQLEKATGVRPPVLVVDEATLPQKHWKPQHATQAILTPAICIIWHHCVGPSNKTNNNGQSGQRKPIVFWKFDYSFFHWVW